jgi:hypothetical protein
MNEERGLLLEFFRQAAAREPALMSLLKQQPDFRVEHEYWMFDLRQLHRLLQHYNPVFKDIEYKAFRRLLYQCPVNQAIKPSGAEIVITDNQSHVDASTYALKWNNTTHE